MVDLLLVFVSASRVFTLLIISFLLFKKWISSDKRFFSDIPFLMGVFFMSWGLSKIIDVYIFANYTLAQANQPDGVLYTLGIMRFYLVVIESVPMWILAVLIWFPNQKKKQIGIAGVAILFNLILLLTATNYIQMLQRFPLILFPVVFLHLLTYMFLYLQKRFPNINNKMLALGFFLMIVNSLMISIYRTPEPQPWGYTWLHELIELGIVAILGYGFLTTSNYKKIVKKVVNPTQIQH